MAKEINPSARDAAVHREAIIAAILTLAVLGTGQPHAVRSVIAEYKNTLQALRGEGNTWN
jgi:hypothetical protein